MDCGNTQKARELRWELLLNKLAQAAGIELTKLPDKKSAADKVILASLMKTHSSVSNSWLAAHLGMGRSASVSQYVGVDIRRWVEENGKNIVNNEDMTPFLLF